SMEHELTAYGRACWAPTIRYHDGWFYIGVNLKSDRYIMCKSRRPEGPYTMYPFKDELYAPGFFIDDDGKKYVTHGKNEIRLTRLNDEGTEIMTPR
ncbi:MAG: family 43 glycosylhydrolase, partial [Bacteroidaceae bacterium]|nr:family 43 glycosylhydrolase [Bacteroidaceae bacterium]